MAAWPLLGIGMAGLLFVYLILGIAGLVALLLLLLAATAMFFLDARRSAGKVF